MDKLDKFKLASSSFGERLMTNSVQMSRIVSTKMKEILQSPSPEFKIVDEATLQTLEEPNWGLNLRICAMINNDQFNGTEIVKAIKKKIGVNNNKNIVGQRLSLDLLETCCSNCDKVFSEVASEKVLDEMVEMINVVRTDDRNRMKAVRLIRAWGESDELMYLPVFRQTHLAYMVQSLKAKGISNTRHGGNSSPTLQTMESMVYEQPMAPPDRYPLPDLDLMGIEDDTIPYTYVGQSMEQKKELLMVGRSSIDLLSSILDSGMEPIPINDELTVSMLDKCKESLPVVQRIAETTNDDDILLFEALNLHDELEQVISRCEEIRRILGSEPLKDDNMKSVETVPSPLNAEETTSTTEVKVKEDSQTALVHKDGSIKKEQTG